ncbi:MAG: hypothetical protein U0133_13125 [Gemmatimonadales bacterium]
MRRVHWKVTIAVFALVAGIACGSDGGNTTGPAPQQQLSKVSGDEQGAAPGGVLPTPFTVSLKTTTGAAVQGDPIVWRVALGGGQLSDDTVLTDASGNASVTLTLGSGVGGNIVYAVWPGHDSLTFHATGTGALTVAGGGNNVTERYTSDLWVADGYAYSGSWGNRGVQGNAVKVWQLNGSGAPALVDSVLVASTSTVSDLQVSDDGKWLVTTTEFGSGAGIHAYELVTPGHPTFRAEIKGVSLHTGALATIGGKLYAFTAKDPASCALRIYDLSDAANGNITQASSTPIPDHYCIHDTFVRDGYAFVFAWDEGLYIFDVGNGSKGGSPTSPQLISHTGSQASIKFGGQTHNGWWYWSPTGDKKYLFIGEEGPGSIGTSSSGDIHVVDVSDFTQPVQVGSFNLPGAGTHNFWVDESRQILYAAYYNGGVVALDISGTLEGDLSSRLIANLKPGGAGNTYVWGVMLYNGSLYASDMLSGLWQLSVP